jgi:hypothetical protein
MSLCRRRVSQGDPVIRRFPSGFTIELESYIFLFRVSQRATRIGFRSSTFGRRYPEGKRVVSPPSADRCMMYAVMMHPHVVIL